MIVIRRYPPGAAGPEPRTVEDLPRDLQTADGVVWIDCEAPTADELDSILDALHVDDFLRVPMHLYFKRKSWV